MCLTHVKGPDGSYIWNSEVVPTAGWQRLGIGNGGMSTTTVLRRTTGQKSFLELLVRVISHQVFPRGKGEGDVSAEGGLEGARGRGGLELAGATKGCDVEMSNARNVFPRTCGPARGDENEWTGNIPGNEWLGSRSNADKRRKVERERGKRPSGENKRLSVESKHALARSNCSLVGG